jgi:dephospho-CoA kinase
MRVGLTGGLAAGKSTVGRWLEAAGFLVIDADRLVAELYRPGAAGAGAVRELFGERYLRQDGGVDRPELARLVFADAEARRRIESRLHPLVAERFERLASGHQGVVVLEAPLLVEAGLAPLFDLVVTVEASPEIQLARAVERGLTESEARARLDAQVSSSGRRQAADVVLENDGSLERLRQSVERLIETIREARERSS